MYTNHKFGLSETVTGGTKRFLELLYGFLENGNTVHLFVPVEANIRHDKNLIIHSIVPFGTRYLPQGFGLFIRNYRTIKETIAGIYYDAFIAVEVSFAVQIVLMRIPKIVLMVWQDFVGCRLNNLNNSSIVIREIASLFLVWAEGTTIKKSQTIIVQSKYDLDILIQRHPKLENDLKIKTRIVPNNVNPQWITNHKKKSISYNNDRSTTDQLAICFIGNINKLKGLEILLSAAKKLIDQKYSIRLNVVGDGKQLQSLKKEYDMYSDIIFWGHRNDAIDILRTCKLLVVPSLFDSFPNTIMEAFFFDIPVIGSNRGGIPDMLKYQELIFEPTADELERKIKEIIDCNLIENYKGLCRKRKEYFTFDWVKEIEKNILTSGKSPVG